ncbi:MAG: hypothetical protein HW384_1037 [Dehalococcoidia bacterium]|nr:hypothetical protein [Dehalococcoidia bacterium]MBF8304080.1 hypothetical protein [Dehalococcoidia bacterium]
MSVMPDEGTGVPGQDRGGCLKKRNGKRLAPSLILIILRHMV